MATKKIAQFNKPETTVDGAIKWNLGEANEKQKLFFNSDVLYTCYGGAKGGGKTWAVRTLALYSALRTYPGIKILIMRAHYSELEINHIKPIKSILSCLPEEVWSYNGSSHILTFYNGSFIKFGHWTGEESENEYNGQEYDWIFIDEATQFSERAFNFLAGCLRGTNDIPKKMFLTCNPGGVGHFWVKRLFIDRKFKVNPDNPEESEDPADYLFIPATIDDNKAVLESSPSYVKMLAKMPNAKAYRYGDWNLLSGNYFKEFSVKTHTHKPFIIPTAWTLYRSFDYGFDMFSCMWWAVDTDGRVWGYRCFERGNLNIQDAAKAILDHTKPDEKIPITYAPPDMWSRQRETGRTTAEIFALNGVPLLKADNNRVQGHMLMRDMMLPRALNDPYVIEVYGGRGKAPEKLPMLMFFDDVGEILEDIESIQADERDPNDCAKDPHEITHSVDACRYFCINRTISPELPEEGMYIESPEYRGHDYDSYMTGGNSNSAYINF